MFSCDFDSRLRFIYRLGSAAGSCLGVCDGHGSRVEALDLGACLVLGYQKSSVAQVKHFDRPRELKRVNALKSLGVNPQFSLKGMTYGVADDFWYSSQGGHPMRRPRNPSTSPRSVTATH